VINIQLFDFNSFSVAKLLPMQMSMWDLF